MERPAAEVALLTSGHEPAVDLYGALTQQRA